MPEYRITFSHSAKRELQRLDPPIAKRLLAWIEKLAANPRPHSCLKLTGSKNDWRIRAGDWRVLYTIDDDRRIVDIAGVRHRSDAYR
jgi:mRNA interferase RelE/StbE